MPHACAVVNVSAGAQSLHDAQALARAATAAGAPCVTVLLGSRMFRLTDPLVLTEADSNTRWVGERGGEITSAVAVPAGSWTLGDVTSHPPPLQHRSSPLAQAPPTVATLNVSGLVNRSEWGAVDTCPGCLIGPAFLTLDIRVNGTWRPMTLARWPNVPFGAGVEPPVNWSTIKSVDVCPSPPQEPDGCAPMSVGVNCTTFTLPDAVRRPLRWARAASEGRLAIHGMFRYLWRDNHVPITAVNAATAQLHTNASFGPYGVTNDSFWYAYNLAEELDNPGEFVLNYSSGELSAVFPAECVDASRGLVLCPTRAVPAVPSLNGGAAAVCLPGNCSTSAMLRVIGASNVTLQGLTVSGSQGAAVGVFGSTNVAIAGCSISGHRHGVVVDGTLRPLAGSWNVSLVDSEVSHTGYAATVWSGGNRTTLTPSRFLVQGNLFHDFGTWTYTYTPGVSVAGVGAVVRQNAFYSSYHAALLFSGNDHVIELNDFSYVTTVGYDSGTIYSGRDLASRGTVIRHNRFHHLDNHATCNAWTSCIRNAIYIDDRQESVSVYGNIFYNVTAGFFSNCGGFMNFTNNLFVDSQIAIRQEGQPAPSGAAAAAMFATLNAVPFRGALWQRRYPGLRRFVDWTVPSSPPNGSLDGPLGNIFSTNLVVNFSQPFFWEQCACCPLGYHYGDLAHRRWAPGYGPGAAPNDARGMFALAASWANSTAHFDMKGTNRKLADPGFASADPGGDLNFTLLPSSPMFALGWRAIPESEIGPVARGACTGGSAN